MYLSITFITFLTNLKSLFGQMNSFILTCQKENKILNVFDLSTILNIYVKFFIYTVTPVMNTFILKKYINFL